MYHHGYMRRSRKPSTRRTDVARELLEFDDEFAALNRSTLFVMQSLVAVLAAANTEDERSVGGAVQCIDWLRDQMRELERRLGNIRRNARAGGL